MQEETFSKVLPALQLAWDSVSSGEFKRCPRAYQLGILLGYQSRERSVDLDFGIFLHSGREAYYYARHEGGLSHDDAVVHAVEVVMTMTWDLALDRPWQGDERKNRFTLIRTLVWYLDHWEHDPLTTLRFSDGRPMVEMSFRIPLNFHSQSTGEEFILCGHLDRVGETAGQVWVNDLKSTKSSLDEGSSGFFFSSFTPDNQISLYTFAGQLVLSKMAQGILLDGAQVAMGFSRFARAGIPRTQSQLYEWKVGFFAMLREAEQCAQEGFWRMNEKVCFRCQFRPVCSLPPGSREDYLEKHYTKREWDPLAVRGEG
jgi:hypothetical protein